MWLTWAVRYKADTVGNSSLHSLHLSSLSAALLSSLIGVSALPAGWRPFSLTGLWTRLHVTGKLTVMLEGLSCLFQFHRPSPESTDPVRNYEYPHFYTLMITAPVSSLLSAVLSLLLHITDSPRSWFYLRIESWEINWNEKKTFSYDLMSVTQRELCISDIECIC